MSTLEYFKKREWSMGNGQCPECNGVPFDWHGHPLYLTTENIGHKDNCELAECLTELGDKPLMIGEYESDLEYESYITDSGFFSTRLKTEDGCPKIKKMNKEFNDKMAEALIKYVDA